jgi:hypothetical protein
MHQVAKATERIEAMNEAHYRDYPSDRAIDHSDYMLSVFEDRFGEPTEAQLQAARERIAKGEWMLIKIAPHQYQYVRKSEVQS